MDRRTFLKVGGGGVAAVAAGMGLEVIPKGPKATELLTTKEEDLIRVALGVTGRHMNSMFGRVRRQIPPGTWKGIYDEPISGEDAYKSVVAYASREALQMATKRGWKEWDTKVVETTPAEMDGRTYDFILIRKSRAAGIIGRFFGRARV